MTRLDRRRLPKVRQQSTVAYEGAKDMQRQANLNRTDRFCCRPCCRFSQNLKSQVYDRLPVRAFSRSLPTKGDWQQIDHGRGTMMRAFDRRSGGSPVGIAAVPAHLVDKRF
ncbi:hypothetical protein [Sphingomonas sp. GC_Shp_3]|uniref:hypothetical protein n=1 Tax=Sphingomonas sp. GC_Shp_3 TaxID=2937383 RepID=UPI00226AE99B|nr:hypothetical protein [Sphingomonas sp. GC_Shp_3]